ncbi:uncharacterized protein LOC129574368 [Sitodiplosis mosellana]|uniref:uncharacterized protein LOC129574368 n=1 Tax=Sitodiplosis mosellana TaxID=263140 RepID=UPI002444DE53|nr:uncharacterized protein LOC129574368 [Sitodiplosis mosellana]
MDNTGVISSNGTPYEKMFKGPNSITAQKAAALTGQQQQQQQFCHRKGFTGGPMYTIGNGSGHAQILMNTQSIMTAGNMHFVPPTRNKSALSASMHCHPTLQPIKVSTSNVSYFMSPQSEQLIMSQSDIILPQSTEMYAKSQSGPEMIVTKPSYAFMNNAHARIASTTAPTYVRIEHHLIKRTSGPIIEENPKFFNNDNQKSTSLGNSGMQTTTKTTTTTTAVEPNTLVNAIKSCVFNYLIKPIIDTTTMFVGTDNNGKSTLNGDTNVWNQHDTKATAGGSPTATNKNHMNSSPNPYTDFNHSSDRFCFTSDKPNYFTYMPDKFFDCDDYIDGGEDTIDFVADSTNLQYNRFGGDLDLDTNSFVQQPSPKDHIFYDCVNKCETPELIAVVQEEVKQKKIADDNLDVVCSTKNTDDVKTTVQYTEAETEEEVMVVERSPINCPKYEKSNQNSYRRKRRGKRKQQQHQYQQQQQKQKHHKANNRAIKGNGQKNRHEKIRHEVEQNIHEDIDDCSVVRDCCVVSYEPDDDDNGDEDDLEIIDVDDEHLPKSHPCTANAATDANAIVTIKSTAHCIETPIPSPEIIKSGCIFTQFFRLDNLNCKQKSWLPLRCMQKQVPPQSKPMLRERPVTCRRISETSESDESFIVFEDNSPRSTTSIDDLITKSTTNLRDNTYKRQRQISECSDDFILFEDDTDDLCRRYDTTDEDFTDSTDDSDNSEDECGDESDSSDCSSISQRKHDGESNQPDSGFEEKKVTFNLCPKVHEIRAWKFAYSQARKGKWEQLGRDRERFEKRINGLSRVLSPILASEHRQKIYEQRFRSDA